MKKKNSMLEGSVLKSIILFALPIMVSSLLQYNYSFIDNIIVGRYIDTNALAAVGSVGAIGSFCVGAALGLTSGFTIPVAHAFGAGDKKMVNKYSGSAVIVALVIGTVAVVFAHLISRPLLEVMGTPAEIIDDAAAYVNILYFGIPVQMLSNCFTAISRSVGESKKPLYFFTVSVIVNFILDIIFVKYFRWGVEGAAFATLISNVVAALLTGIYIFRFNSEINVKKSDFKPDYKIAWYQIKLGIPVSLQFTVTSIGSMAMQSAVNSFGTNVIAGFTAAGKVERLANIPLSGLGVANQTFVGQNYGAKNYERIIKSVKKILILDLSVSVLMSLFLVGAGPFLVKLFMTEVNEEMVYAAGRYLVATAQCFSLVAILFVMRNSLQGMGFTYANTIAGAGELVGRIAIALVFTKLIGFAAVCYSAPAAWLLADIPLIIIYLHKKKQFRKIIKEEKLITETAQTE